ncbi:lipase family protein [Mycobacterium sp. IDR2000157661]|uniref:lipase family protein n=1 Tax=Mycobacterium sp. IDR2000157661 TaxID=2867005 RepID=UPI001EEABE3E|nr:lipase family protein [Mycobacterium sp. IDR2000157661]ULE33619.1 lipase family protein [Mycobacterium sp. IDR2000157661]
MSIVMIACGLVVSGVAACRADPVVTEDLTGPPISAEPDLPPPHVWLPLDEFYERPARIPPKPGVLLKNDRLTDRLLPPRSRAWRMMYSTRLPDNTPATAVATVLAPERPSPQPSPVILFQHGTVGIKQKCMPSTMTTPFEGVPGLEEVVRRGWVVIATDYQVDGDGVIPFLVGEGEARSTLDSLRAARQMPELQLANRAVVWGHSQGGHAALWTGIARGDYAPDIKLSGIAASAPATDLEELARIYAQGVAAATSAPYLATAYSQYYPDVQFDDVVPEGAREISREIADLCPEPQELLRLQQLGSELGAATVAPMSATGPFADRLRENTPNQTIDVPVLVVQGLTDPVIPPSVTDAFVDRQCAAGQDLAYWRVVDRDHNTVLAADGQIPEMLVSWTDDRLAGKIQTGCQTTTLRG